jgi:hypothetical protein
MGQIIFVTSSYKKLAPNYGFQKKNLKTHISGQEDMKIKENNFPT